MPRRLPYLIWVLLLLSGIGTFGAAAQAAEPEGWRSLADIIFQPLRHADGTATPMSFALTQDTEGFIWVGTGDGLARWDGYRFQIYRYKPHVQGALPGNFIQALHTDRHGKLWIGTTANGLASYDRDHDSFVPYAFGTRDSDRMDIRTIIDDGSDGLWVGSGSGLYHLDLSDGATRHVGHERNDPASLPEGRVSSLLLDRSGTLWVGTEHGLYRRDPETQGFRAVPLTGSADAAGAIQALMLDAGGRVWVGTLNQGAFVISADRRAIRQVQEPEGTTGPVQALTIECLLEIRPGEIWIGTTGSGIVAVDGATLRTRRIRHDPTRATSLVDDTVWSLYKDRSGLVWVGTNQGVTLTDPRELGILTMFGVTGRRDGVSDPDVTAVLAAADGRVWLGLPHDGIDILDPATARIVALRHDAGFPLAILEALAPAGDGGVYIATWHGLYHAEGSGAGITQIPLPGPRPDRPVTALARIEGTLWIGDSEALYRLGSDGGGIRQIVSGDELTDKRVRKIAPAPSGKLWIGTWNGLNLLDPATHRVDQIPANPADPTALSAGLITSLLTDRQGRLWVGTYGGGISILTGEAENGQMEFTRLGTDEGLPNVNVDTLLNGPDGHVWASTDDGIAEIDPVSLQIHSFHLAQGVAIGSYWTDSGAVTPQGDLLFGGSGGLTIIRPGHLSTRLRNAPVAVTDIHVGNRQVPPGRTSASGAIPPIVLRPEANSLTVEFSALDYTDPGRNRFAHKLDGLEKDWIPNDPGNRLVSYSNLPVGDYLLRLRGSNADGVWSETSLPITVLPAWYQTLWFRLAAVLMSILVVALMLRLQTARLSHRQSELEQQIKQRTVELRQSNWAMERAAETLRDLGTIGQQITASLDLDTVLSVLHQNVTRLLDAPHFAVYLMQRASQNLVLRFGMQDDKPLLPDAPTTTYHRIHINRAISERREVVVVGYTGTPASGNSGSESGDLLSVICAPLIVHDRVIGVMLIQSPRVYAYGDRERLIFSTLCAYAAIALDNAATLVALAEVQAQLEHLAYSDGLTNLPNRRVYIDEFDRFVTRSRQRFQPFALLLIDLDRFKQINDTYGHDAGDALLVETAARLKASVRSTDVVIRLGGDEFAILLSNVDDPKAIEYACTRIADSFAEGLNFKGVTVPASSSIGVALFPYDGDTQERLYKAADVALYEAKRAGRNTWRRYDARYGGDDPAYHPSKTD